VIIGIVLLVGWLIYAILANFTELDNSKVANFTHSNTLEIVWTSLPALGC
jgi:heme/copper-type cytochrome/quinol oxidase subunit 2